MAETTKQKFPTPPSKTRKNTPKDNIVIIVKFHHSNDSEMFFNLADSDSSETFIARNDPTSSIQALEGRVPNYLLLVSLLEQLCSLYEGDSEKSKKIFTGRSSNWCSLAHFDQY